MKKLLLAFFFCLVASLFYYSSPQGLGTLDKYFETLSQVFKDEESAFQKLNLGFEELNQGWQLSGIGYTKRYDQTEKHAGFNSMRIEHVRGEVGNAFAGRALPISSVRGKRLRFAAYVKTLNVATGGAGLWLDVYGADGNIAFDNMSGRLIVGSSDWRRVEIALDVPEEAVGVSIGCSLWGNGIVWFDSLELILEPIDESPPLIEINGFVRGSDDQPRMGATVVLISPLGSRVIDHTLTNESGRFVFEAPKGNYALTTMAPGQGAAYQEFFSDLHAGQSSKLTLSDQNLSIDGRVIDERGLAAEGVWVRFQRLSEDGGGESFWVQTDGSGHYSASLIPGDGYRVDLKSDIYWGEGVKIEGNGDQNVDVRASRKGVAAPQTVVTAIANKAITIASTLAGRGFEDLQQLRSWVGDARVVALGESTHGSREFFQLKHRLLEFLVQEMGFSVFAIEANYAESLAINDYVLTGVGSAREALEDLGYWTWNTEEVLDLINWMRSYNVDPNHHRKLQFYGFDMNNPRVSAQQAISYFATVDPEYADKLKPSLVPLISKSPRENFRALATQDQQQLGRMIDEAISQFDQNRKTCSAKTDNKTWTLARQHLVILSQVIRLYSESPHFGFGDRDLFMAENLQWILETEPPGTRVVAWAHNSHISRDIEGGMNPMGSYMVRSMGDDYRAMALTFGRGSFQAKIDFQGGGIKEHTVGLAPVGFLESAFTLGKQKLAILDLRKDLDHPELANWLRAPHPTRSIGARFSIEQEALSVQKIVVTRHFDAIAFIDETTRARPLSRTQ